ncbi:MAG: hypothetical protein ACOC0O_06970 [Spirochaetota bacterium]
MKRTTVIGPIALLALFAVTAGCSGRGENAPPRRVNTDHLGSVYENAALGIAFRPPQGWQPLEAAQRERVAQALLAREDDDAWNLRVTDLFLDAETLSFAALSEIVREGEPVTEPDAYLSTFVGRLEDALAPESDDALEQARFTLNGLPVVMIRYRLNGRDTTSVVLVRPGEPVVQIDYSIPAGDDPERAARIESSVGTLQPLGSGNEE